MRFSHSQNPYQKPATRTQHHHSHSQVITPADDDETATAHPDANYPGREYLIDDVEDTTVKLYP